MTTLIKNKTENKEIIKLYNLILEDFDMLKELLKFESVSGKESKVAMYITEKLVELGFTAKKDGKGNIFAVRGEADKYPLLNAHMDIVNLLGRFGYRSRYTSASKKTESKSYSSLVVENYNYDNYLSKEVEDAKSRINESRKAKIEVTDEEANELWEKDKEELKLLFGKEFNEIGFRCQHCVNTCRSYKLCHYFQPNDSIESKRQYAKYIKEVEANKKETKKDDVSFIQQSFDIDSNLKTLREPRYAVRKDEKEKDKYIIKMDLINDRITGSGKDRVLGGDDKCGSATRS